ncbi:MAG: VOC family protein [Maricaulaceae bacterium]|jgi:catechol 2,3-dioxygenase-like lactoylglutathione lyase family enzyme
MKQIKMDRRAVLAGLGAAALPGLAAPAFGQVPPGPGRGNRPPPTEEEIAAALPLKTTGLEHFAMLVPDVALAGRFYSKLFNPDGLHKEARGNLRYYVTLDPGYVAIGGRDEPPPPYMDHFCALVEDYNAGAMSARLEQEGVPPGRVGILPDPNGIGLQLLGVPGGLAGSTEPASRVVNGDALVTPMGLDHMLLFVNDLEESLAFYSMFFDGEVIRETEPDRAWIVIENTRLGLQARPSNAPPRVDQFGVKIAPFDREALSAELRIIGATIAPDDPHDPSVLRCRDPHGFGIALVPTS